MTIIELEKKMEKTRKELKQTVEHQVLDLLYSKTYDEKSKLGIVHDVQFTFHEGNGEFYFGVSIPSKAHSKLCSISESKKVHNITEELEKHPQKEKILKIAMNYWSNCWGGVNE